MEDNPDNFKWGIIYYNPDDTRLFVPKSIKWAGWTINFANPFAYVIIAGIIVAVILSETLR